MQLSKNTNKPVLDGVFTVVISPFQKPASKTRDVAVWHAAAAVKR